MYINVYTHGCERALDAMMPFNCKVSACLMDQTDLFSVSFCETLLSLTFVDVGSFSSMRVYLYLGNGSTNDANQMLLNIPCNQPIKTTTVSTHCSLTSLCQGREQNDEDEQEQEQVNEYNIADDSQQQRQGEIDRDEDASSHNVDVGSTNEVVLSSKTKKLKHCYSSATLLPCRLLRSSSTLTETTPMTAMLRHRHQSSHPHRDTTYRTLQWPVNSSNKLLIATPNGQHRSQLSTTAGSENSLQTTGLHIYPGANHHPHTPITNCFDEETVRTLSRGKSTSFQP